MKSITEGTLPTRRFAITIHLTAAGLASLIAAASHAGPIPTLANATSIVSVVCNNYGSYYPDNAGPLPFGLSLACDKSESGVGFPFGYASWQPVASVHTGLGTTSGRVGLVDAMASSRATGAKSEAESGASGIVDYAIALLEIQPAPFSATGIPIRFSASAEGHFSQGGDIIRNTGSYSADAYLAVDGFPRSLFRIDHHDLTYNSSDSLNESVSLWLKPLESYFGSVSAGCGVHAFGSWDRLPIPNGTPLTGWAECVAVADPLLTLDQGSFDQLYGTDSFPLDQYYRLAFSPNIPAGEPAPIPEPSTLLMSLAGLGLLASRRKT